MTLHNQPNEGSLWNISRNSFFILFSSFYLSTILLAGTTGKIAGKVTDAETNDPLPSVNVILEGTTLGAITDLDGNYVILNVPPGVYRLVSNLIGYQKVQIIDVRVSVDFTTRVEIKMKQGAVDLPPIVVEGERTPLIRQDLTNPVASIPSERIQQLPVDNINQVIRLQAGVVVDNSGAIHVRGGRSNEIAYTVNGVSINNPFSNTQSIGIATNAVEEVSFSAGTFTAEYGDALSGVINFITKEGGDTYHGSVRAYSGDKITRNKDLFFNISDVDPTNRYRVEGTLGGPFPFFNNDVKFFLSGVYARNKGYLYGIRIFRPTDSYLIPNEFPNRDRRSGSSTDPYFFNPFVPNGDGKPTGDGAIVPMNTSKSINFAGKVTFKFSPTFKLNYDLIFDDGKSQSYDRAYVYNPDGRPTDYDQEINHSMSLTHILSNKAFYTVKASYLRSFRKSYVYSDPYDPRYVPSFFARPLSNTAFLAGGVDLSRDFSKSRTFLGKFDIVAQLFGNHEIKFGVEARLHQLDLESYALRFDKQSSQDLINDQVKVEYHAFIPTPDRTPDDLSYVKYMRKPTQASAYIQDKIELARSLILNLGLRYDYLDPNAPFNPNISQELTNQNFLLVTQNLQPASKKHRVSPRVSVSYPITDRGIIRFSYGHFYQYPTYVDPNGNLRLSTIYRNPDFKGPRSVTPSFGNPNLEPQKSVQYEIGLQQQLASDLKLDLTGFYKDVTNYIDLQTIRTANGDRTYTIIANLNYANVKGVTISLLKRRSPQGLFSATLDYTFSVASGNRTDTDAFFFDEQSGKQTERFLVPLSFDREHVLNGTIALDRPNNWTASAIVRFQTRTPYTPSLPANLAPISFQQNSDRRPINWNVDLLLEKYFRIGSVAYSLFLRVDNLFDTVNEIFIYTDSGRSLSSVFEVVNAHQFDDLRGRLQRGDFGSYGPTFQSALDKYYQRADFVGAPREIRAGMSMSF